MKEISLLQVRRLMAQVAAVSIDGELSRPFCHKSCVEFFWTDDEGMEHELALNDSYVVEFDGSTMYAGGYEILLLVPMKKNVDKL